MRTLTGLTLLLATALLCTSAVAGDTYYKWKDADGTVHYGEKPPEGTTAARLDVDTRAATPIAPAATAETEAAAGAQADAAGNAAATQDIALLRQQACDRAKRSVALLESGAQVSATKRGDTAVAAPMSEGERARQLSDARANSARLCAAPTQ